MKRLNSEAGAASVLVCSEDGYYQVALGNILVDRLQIAKVIAVENLDQAIDELAVANDRIDLALFDLAMPGLTRATIRVLRDAFPAMHVVLVAASRSRGDVLVSLEAGVHGILARDIKVEGLIDALNRVRDGQIYVPPFLAETADASEGKAVASA